jgi:hypothetical protein
MSHRTLCMTNKISHFSFWTEFRSGYDGSRIDGVDSWFDCHNQWQCSVYIMVLSLWVSAVIGFLYVSKSSDYVITVGDQFFFVDFAQFHSKGWNVGEERHKYFNWYFATVYAHFGDLREAIPMCVQNRYRKNCQTQQKVIYRYTGQLVLTQLWGHHQAND